MKTKFAIWLEDRGETVFAFSKRTGLGLPAVRRLAGIGHGPLTIHGFQLSFLQRVRAETGITIQRLQRDALRAAKDPIPPRAYRRKQENENGETAEERT